MSGNCDWMRLSAAILCGFNPDVETLFGLR